MRYNIFLSGIQRGQHIVSFQMDFITVQIPKANQHRLNKYSIQFEAAATYLSKVKKADGSTSGTLISFLCSASPP